MRLPWKVGVLFLVFVTVVVTGYSQRQSPIFASKEDSAAFARVTRAIDAIVQSDPNGVMPGNPMYRKLDSLRKIQLLVLIKNPFENQADVARVKDELQARGAIVHVK